MPLHVFIGHSDILCVCVCEVLFKSFVESSAILKNNYYSSLWYNSGSVD